MLGFIKSYGRVVLAAWGFVYDLKRYFLYAGWRARLTDKSQRNYYLVRVYHALEKSMSFSNRRPGAGWKNADTLIDLLEVSKKYDHGFHDALAIKVLKEFSEIESGSSPQKSRDLQDRLKKIEGHYSLASDDSNPGVANLGREALEEGMLTHPESFFFSRYSVREFSCQKVEHEKIERAVALAMKSPSVCNRQAWHVYYLKGSAVQEALSLQSGNRGFGEEVKDLMLVATDLSAFCSPTERYQHWIDGGMFSMSLIWAFHSLGLASCCLNWSQSGGVDMKLRKRVPIQPEHTVMMMIAVGYPNEDNKVCRSVRRPLSEVLTQLDDE